MVDRFGKAGSALAILVAFGVDALGEPPAAIHPVIWFGKLIRCLEHFAPAPPRRSWQLLYGGVMPILALGLVVSPTLLLQSVFNRLSCAGSKDTGRYGGVVMHGLLLGVALKPFFALRMLADAGEAVRLALEKNDLMAARDALLSLVSRDRSQLSVDLVAAAAVESLAENMSDAVVAPLFYYVCWGLPGAVGYRLINTFDSMIGYHGKYEYLGKFAARLDDLLNLVPSRLTALMIIVCAPLYGGKWRSAGRIWWRDGRKTESPNAGQPMAAAAGALGIQLEKVDHYQLGDAERPVNVEDIRRAERMVWCVGGLTLILSMALRYLCSSSVSVSRRKWYA